VVGMKRPGAFSAMARQQYAAVAAMRWQMLRHSLRTKRGNFELAARIFTTVFFSLVGLAAGVGLGFGAYAIASSNSLHLLPLLFWPVFLLWQFFPVMAASFQEHTDMSGFLRFPMSFASYMLMTLVFGLFDAAGLIGTICLYGIGTGLVVAHPGAVVGIGMALLLFAIFNVLLTRMIFAWIDRWLAQRRSREILGVGFLFLLLSFQLINPLIQHYQGHRQPIDQKTLQTAERVQSLLPPGATAAAVRLAMTGHVAGSLEAMGGLVLYGAAAGMLLGLRLRAEYRGENLGEGAPRTAKTPKSRAATEQAGAMRGGFSGGSGLVGAVVEKELRYLSRSGIMLYSLVAPLIMMVVFGSNGSHGGPGMNFIGRFALPVGVAYSFLGLTRLIYNSLGGEGPGIQLYFTAPIRFRTVMMAKNLVQLGLFCVELGLVCVIVYLRYGIPDATMLVVTFCWLLFALPLQLAAGNLLSIKMAYRMTLTRMSREEGAAGNALTSLGVQLAVVGLGAAVFLPLSHYGYAGAAGGIFLLLAAVSAGVWLRIASKIDSMAAARREELIQTLARA
jgi:ABC-2 type transport system permease protein